MAAVDKPEIFEFETVPIRIIDDLAPAPAVSAASQFTISPISTKVDQYYIG